MMQAAAVIACAFATLAIVPFPPPSEPTGVFALLDKVVLLPDREQATSVELHGAFAVAEGGRGDYYRAPRTGVLRFTAGADAAESRKQWRDLAQHAGKGTVVAFGFRHEMNADGKVPVRVLAADEAPGTLPPFTTAIGVHVIQNHEWGPVRELLLLPRCLPVEIDPQRRHPEWPSRALVFQCTNCIAGDTDLRYVFTVETSDGDRFASGPVTPGKGLTAWRTDVALQLGERVTWSVQVVGDKVARAPQDRGTFTAPASAFEKQR
jgi:hypothetical protein